MRANVQMLAQRLTCLLSRRPSLRADTPSAREIAGKVGARQMGILTNDGGKESDVEPGLAQKDLTCCAGLGLSS